MALKVFVVVLIVGVVLTALGWWLEQPRELTLEESVARLVRRDSTPVARHGTLGRVVFWVGAGLFVAGGVGLFFCGVRKSYLTGGASHE